MTKLSTVTRWFVPAFILILQTGCINRLQVNDFARTEVARITADIVGRLVALFQMAT